MDTSTGMPKNHLEVLKLGVSEWNKWRVERGNIAPELKGADLHGASLAGADLRAVNFKGADLRGANLRGANLKAADLRAANLKEAILWSASLTGADLRSADLTNADIRGVNFRAANLMNAILVGVSTNDYTDFRHATVTGARLWEDGEPIPEDWEAEAAKVADAYTSKVIVRIEVCEPVSFSNIAWAVPLIEDIFYEYEKSFILSLRSVVGELLADACLFRLESERKKIYLCKRWSTISSDIEAVAFPLAFRILDSAVYRDIDDIWKRITLGGTIKKALAIRAGRAGEELQKLLNAAVAQKGSINSVEVCIKAEKDLNRAPQLTIELKHGKNPAQKPTPPQTSGGHEIKQ